MDFISHYQQYCKVSHLLCLCRVKHLVTFRWDTQSISKWTFTLPKGKECIALSTQRQLAFSIKRARERKKKIGEDNFFC